MATSPNCFLCGDLEGDPRSSGIAQLYGSDVLARSILWQDDSLYIIPAPGTLTPGYLIIAPRAHFNSFAELDEPLLHQVDRLRAAIINIGIEVGLPDYMLFEHGAVDDYNRGSACVSHAHLHVTPCPSPSAIRDLLQRSFTETQLGRFPDIARLRGGPPYIFLQYPDQVYAYDTPIAPSQLIRKYLAAQLGTPSQWDWRSNPLLDNYLKTIELFTNRLTANV